MGNEQLIFNKFVKNQLQEMKVFEINLTGK